MTIESAVSMLCERIDAIEAQRDAYRRALEEIANRDEAWDAWEHIQTAQQALCELKGS